MEKNDTNKHDETNYQTKLQQRSKNYNSNRRGKNKMKYNSHNMKIIHSNIDGFISKQESLQDIIQSEKPDIVTLNDTALKGKRKVKIDNYFSYDKNRTKSKGGISTLVANYLKGFSLKVTKAVKIMSI